MEIREITGTPRSAAFSLDDGGIYHTKKPYRLVLNGNEIMTTNLAVTSLFDLLPDTGYHLQVLEESGEPAGELDFHTPREKLTINVRDLGAAGDGVRDDTVFIQSAIAACPEGGRVLIPEGKYRITSLFLKSCLYLELALGAELLASTNRWDYPIFPGEIEPADGEMYQLGTWEGEPRAMFSGILTGMNLHDVVIYGEGTINGCASFDNWWHNEKEIVGACRPRLLFLNHCQNVTIHGVHFTNSPSWTIHPYFCQNLTFCGSFIENPLVSPNTDGINPESCTDVEIVGVHFSVGDDCIAVKSGKLYMGKKYKTPSENIHIHQCLMENGHGAVTLGSEISAGVKNLLAEKCLFSRTDRGLRIKTRRGRGKDSVLDGIIFRDILMDQVMTPFTLNAFYFCDADGKSDYVQSRDPLSVDERTPGMGKFLFENIRAKNCHVAAAYFAGLPESKISLIKMKNCTISFAPEARSGIPIMTLGVGECCKKGIHAENVQELILENVAVDGAEGEDLELSGVSCFTRL